MQEVPEECEKVFENHGLKMSGSGNRENKWLSCWRGVRSDREICGYLRGTVTEDGDSEAEVFSRIQIGENAWRRVEGEMASRKISGELKWKVLVSYVMPAYLSSRNGDTDRQQQGLQVCETTGLGGLRK